MASHLHRLAIMENCSLLTRAFQWATPRSSGPESFAAVALHAVLRRRVGSACEKLGSGELQEPLWGSGQSNR